MLVIPFGISMDTNELHPWKSSSERFGRYSETYIPDENMLALKNLTRFRLSISDICGSLKKKVIAILDQVFPEYTGVFSDVFGKTSKQLLEQFSTPDEFMDISTTKLTNLLLKVSRGRNGREKAVQGDLEPHTEDPEGHR